MLLAFELTATFSPGVALLYIMFDSANGSLRWHVNFIAGCFTTCFAAVDLAAIQLESNCRSKGYQA